MPFISILYWFWFFYIYSIMSFCISSDPDESEAYLVRLVIIKITRAIF
uniref:Uncharacterized protein n=1 Tax=Heterorhabditis bacteriophora TaxID=37862 RepID=A0A1I7WI13_HETBA